MTTPRDRVQFTRESAERIASVVRQVELTPTGGRPMSFEPVQSQSQVKPFRMATFTAAWGTGTSQVLTFKNQTTTPNTVAAFNQLYDVAPLNTAQPQTCAIAKEGTAWYFVNTNDGGEVRRGSFTGAWSKGATKTVSLEGGGTASAINTFLNIPSAAGTRDCVVAIDGSGWRLLNFSMECSSGIDHKVISTGSASVLDDGAGYAMLVRRSSEDCASWASLNNKITVITAISVLDTGSGPIIRCTRKEIVCVIGTASPETVDILIPVGSCE
jgi:hypothetical protein